MDIPITKETSDDISQLSKMTNKDEGEIVSTALNRFLKKIPMIGTVTITFFGLAIHVSQLAFNGSI